MASTSTPNSVRPREAGLDLNGVGELEPWPLPQIRQCALLGRTAHLRKDVTRYNPASGSIYRAGSLRHALESARPQWQTTSASITRIPWVATTRSCSPTATKSHRSFVTFLAVDRPNNDNYQGGFAKIDLGLTLESPKDLWEIALIGKDLNDRDHLRKLRRLAVGNGLPRHPILPASRAARRPLGIDPAGCFVDPGREIWLRFTIRPIRSLRITGFVDDPPSPVAV